MTERVRQPGHSPSRNVANVTTVHKFWTGRQSRHYLWQGSGSNVPWYPTKAPAPEHERTLEIVAATSKCPKRLSTVQPATSHLPRKTAHSHGACSAILGVAVGDLGPSGRLL